MVSHKGTKLFKPLRQIVTHNNKILEPLMFLSVALLRILDPNLSYWVWLHVVKGIFRASIVAALVSQSKSARQNNNTTVARKHSSR